MIFSDFCILHQNHFQCQMDHKKNHFKKVFLVHLAWKMVFFSILYGKKVTLLFQMTFFLWQENPFFLQNDFSFSFRIIRAWVTFSVTLSTHAWVTFLESLFARCKNNYAISYTSSIYIPCVLFFWSFMAIIVIHLWWRTFFFFLFSEKRNLRPRKMGQWYDGPGCISYGID